MLKIIVDSIFAFLDDVIEILQEIRWTLAEAAKIHLWH